MPAERASGSPTGDSHVPHLLVAPPWDGDVLSLSDGQAHHLHRVLRTEVGEPVSYTDGTGRRGVGILEPGSVRRGDEQLVPPPAPRLTLAVAPPRAAERARFLVEKVAELGVDRLVWLSFERGQGRPPRVDKAAAWAQGALEQSRGAWLMTIDGPVTMDELEGTVWIADPDGAGPAVVKEDLTVVVGPEGGIAPQETIAGSMMVSLGARVLRVETAAVVAAALVLHYSGRMVT